MDDDQASGTRIIAFFERRPPFLVFLWATAMIAGLGVLDFVTGKELRFFVFYWPPIALVAWVSGRRWGLLAVLVSGLAWLLALLPLAGSAEAPQVVAWNLLINLLSFSILVLGVTHIRDMSHRQRTLALTDHMTGVANARAFLATLHAELALSRRKGTHLSLAYLDIDDFKSINDTAGHDGGNDLLRAIALTIRTTLRAGDTVARLGGDEFAILLPDSSLPQARAVVERVLERLAGVVRHDSRPVTYSVGLVSCSRPDCTHEKLLQHADVLMYEVKRDRKNGLRTLDLTRD